MAAVWLRNLETAGGLGLPVAWKTFSLEQVNLDGQLDPDELWDTASERRGLLPAAVQKWAEERGPEDLAAVQLAFFDARHVDRKKIGRPEVVAEVLTAAGYEGEKVAEELLSDRRWLQAARADHEEGVGLGVFGVPTLVFPDTAPVFVRLTEIPEGDRAREVYERVRTMAADPLIHEVKRP